MPKVNIYLSDDLAERVRRANLPMSRICQTALQNALDSTVDIDIAPDTDVEALPEELNLELPLGVHVIGFLRIAYTVAAERGSRTVDTEHLLQGFLDEGDSLVLHTIERTGISRKEIQARLDSEIEPITTGSNSTGRTPLLADSARAVLNEGARKAIAAGATVLNGGHFLLGMYTDPGIAGTVLKDLGIDKILNATAVAALHEAVTYRAALTTHRVDSWLVASITSLISRLDRMENRLEEITPRTR